MKKSYFLPIIGIAAALLLFSSCEKELIEPVETDSELKMASKDIVNKVGVQMGTWDTDGDGVNEIVYNAGSYIQITELNGSSPRNYSNLGVNWSLISGGAVDTDGITGIELCINMGSKIRIIRDKARTSYDYNLPATWSLLGITDTDGSAGAEIIYNGGSYINSIVDRTKYTASYYVGSTWSLTKIIDTDGYAGAEIIYNSGLYLNWIIQRTGNTSSYYLGNSWSILTNGICDTDSHPGAEVCVNKGNYVWIIDQREGYYRQYYMGSSWSLSSIYNLDGVAGNEIVYYAGSRYALCDRTGSQYKF